jgi:hypothetical protein
MNMKINMDMNTDMDKKHGNTDVDMSDRDTDIDMDITWTLKYSDIGYIHMSSKSSCISVT